MLRLLFSFLLGISSTGTSSEPGCVPNGHARSNDIVPCEIQEEPAGAAHDELYYNALHGRYFNFNRRSDRDDYVD